MRRFDGNGDALSLVIATDDEVARPSLRPIALNSVWAIEHLQDALAGQTVPVKLLLIVVINRESLDDRSRHPWFTPRSV